MNGAQLYDLLFPVVTRESAWRPRLISQLVAGLPVTTTKSRRFCCWKRAEIRPEKRLACS